MVHLSEHAPFYASLSFTENGRKCTLIIVQFTDLMDRDIP